MNLKTQERCKPIKLISKKTTKMVENQSYLVPLCVPQKVSIENSTENHVTIEVSIDGTPVLPGNEITNTDYTVFCRHCGLHYNSMKEYEAHINTKNSSKNTCKRMHACAYCPASFNRNDHLKRHVTSLHMNMRHKTCPVCSEDCKTNDTLLKHIKMHPNPAAFNCRDCNKGCISLQDLVDHESTHIWPELHLCSYCNKAFKRRDHMLRHIRTAHFQQYTECPICNQKFKRRDHTVRHMREKHKMPGGLKELF